jgi:hypothetical protein
LRRFPEVEVTLIDVDPALLAIAAGVLGDDSRAPDFTPPLAWHVAALRAAGFAEAGCVWRHGSAAMVVAVR